MEKEFYIPKESELRLEVKGSTTIEIKLLSGRAEILGSELEINRIYPFSPSTNVVIPVFTWHSCCIKISSEEYQHSYISSETPMLLYLNAHACLEKLSQLSEQNGTFGPITMVTGDHNVGKSTLCKLLVNYAVKEGRSPIFINVDPGDGAISLPGTLGAAVVKNEISIDGEFLNEDPIVYAYGSVSLSSNPDLFSSLLCRLGEVTQEKLASNSKVASSGAIINTFGWTSSQGYKLLLNVAQAFEVEVILVMGDEKLYNNINRDIPFVKVHFVPQSDVIRNLSKEYRRSMRENQVRTYFYGKDDNLETYTFDVQFSQLRIYQTEHQSDTPLPAGTSEEAKLKLQLIEPHSKLKRTVLAVSFTSEVEDALLSPVAGFVCLLQVNLEDKIYTVLSPHPPPLSDAIFMLTQQILPSSSHS